MPDYIYICLSQDITSLFAKRFHYDRLMLTFQIQDYSYYSTSLYFGDCMYRDSVWFSRKPTMCPSKYFVQLSHFKFYMKANDLLWYDPDFIIQRLKTISQQLEISQIIFI